VKFTKMLGKNLIILGVYTNTVAMGYDIYIYKESIESIGIYSTNYGFLIHGSNGYLNRDIMGV